MKYKKGDKVRVRHLLAMEREFGVNSCKCINIPNAVFTPSMKQFCRQVVTIKKVYDKFYTIEEDNERFSWVDEMFEGYAFEYGDEAEFSLDGLTWKKGIYVGYIDGAIFPYKTVRPSEIDKFKTGNVFSNVGWKYARPIGKKHTIIIDNYTIEISEESYQNLKKALLTLDGGQKDDGDTTDHS